MKSIPSDYTEYKEADPKTKIKAGLADLAVFFCLCLLLFGGLFLPLGDSFPFIAAAKSRSSEDTKEVMAFVDETRLQRIKEDRSALVPVETGFDTAVKKLIRTTYYYHQNDSEDPLAYTELDENKNEKTIPLTLTDTISFTYNTDGTVAVSCSNHGYQFFKAQVNGVGLASMTTLTIKAKGASGKTLLVKPYDAKDNRLDFTGTDEQTFTIDLTDAVYTGKDFTQTLPIIFFYLDKADEGATVNAAAALTIDSIVFSK